MSINTSLNVDIGALEEKIRELSGDDQSSPSSRKTGSNREVNNLKFELEEEKHYRQTAEQNLMDEQKHRKSWEEKWKVLKRKFDDIEEEHQTITIENGEMKEEINDMYNVIEQEKKENEGLKEERDQKEFKFYKQLQDKEEEKKDAIDEVIRRENEKMRQLEEQLASEQVKTKTAETFFAKLQAGGKRGDSESSMKKNTTGETGEKYSAIIESQVRSMRSELATTKEELISVKKDLHLKILEEENAKIFGEVAASFDLQELSVVEREKNIYREQERVLNESIKKLSDQVTTLNLDKITLNKENASLIKSLKELRVEMKGNDIKIMELESSLESIDVRGVGESSTNDALHQGPNEIEALKEEKQRIENEKQELESRLISKLHAKSLDLQKIKERSNKFNSIATDLMKENQKLKELLEVKHEDFLKMKERSEKFKCIAEETRRCTRERLDK